MLRVFLILLVFLFTIEMCISQPPICGPSPQMTSFCKDACIICDIDGFTGRNNSNVTGQAPPGFCTSFVHHMQWIGFIAGTTNLTLEVKVSNCQRNAGLEIGLYQSTNCTTFSRVSECDTDVRPGQTRIFKNTIPLVVGQYYYFVMDGSNNDICDWTIKVTEGSTKVLPLNDPPQMTIPNIVCIDEAFEMKTPGLIGATFYNWTIDGALTKSGTTVTHSLSKPGTYEICLDASNVCDIAPRNCKKIEVLPNPTSTIYMQVCFGQCVAFHNKDYCQTGIYEVRVPTPNGCDSILIIDLVVDDRINSSTSLNICQGDTLFLGNGKFFAEGNFNTIIQNEEGCNIYMEVALKVIKCDIQSFVQSIPVKCNGESNGEIKFKVDVGTPPFTFQGFKVENSSNVISGSIQDVNQWITVSGVGEGNYTINIEDTFGNSKVINVFVPQPTKLNLVSQTSLYNDYQISCFGGNDGYIKLNPKGGLAPYKYVYDSNNSTSDSIGFLSAGVYTATVLDKNNCAHTITTELKSPDSLNLKYDFVNPNCDGPLTGRFNISSIIGGVAPYDIFLNTKKIGTADSFFDLKEGTYLIQVTDLNGCKKLSSFEMRAALIPEIIVNGEIHKIKLGDSLLLSVISNLSDQFVKWSPPTGIMCDTCLSTFSQPIGDTTYEIVVTSADGCETRSSIKVEVEKIRSFVIANVVTANNDSQNDKISYFAGSDVALINYINYYDRWGNLLYKDQHISPKGFAEVDWDFKFHGSPLQVGVYTWVASISYIDGIEELYSGSFSLLK